MPLTRIGDIAIDWSRVFAVIRHETQRKVGHQASLMRAMVEKKTGLKPLAPKTYVSVQVFADINNDEDISEPFVSTGEPDQVEIIWNLVSQHADDFAVASKRYAFRRTALSAVQKEDSEILTIFFTLPSGRITTIPFTTSPQSAEDVLSELTAVSAPPPKANVRAKPSP